VPGVCAVCAPALGPGTTTQQLELVLIRCTSVRRVTSTSLFVLGYALMAMLDANVAFLPCVSLFAAGSALIVKPAFL
jgi:hypothetical protein